jgi:DNA-binding MarR family transcriptional regulator
MKELPFDNEFYGLWLLLSQTRSAIFKARHKKFGQYMHPNQAATLVAVWRYSGQATPAMLSRHLFLEPHTTSELITRMAKKGLIKKSRDKTRKNGIRVSITEKGREMCSNVMHADFIRSIMSSLSEAQRQQLQSWLTILNEAAQKELREEAQNQSPEV